MELNQLIHPNSYLSLKWFAFRTEWNFRSELAKVDKFTCLIELVAEHFLSHNTNIILDLVRGPCLCPVSSLVA